MELSKIISTSDTKIALSVLMPVYNGGKFLNQAIDSILNQSFVDFEFIIINDGSIDTTEQIIRSYSDPRIILINNEKNLGLVESLNKGIILSNGKYLARMDCDDISLQSRLKMQIEYLEKNPEVSLIAGNIELIDTNGNATGSWPEDSQTRTDKEIKAMLPFSNCIAHPTVMIRTSIAKKYLYNPKQGLSEDWDLWLRMASDGHKMEKINSVILQYRLHNESFTHKNNQRNVYRKISIVQSNFFLSKLKIFKINLFDLKVFLGFTQNSFQLYTGGKFKKYKNSIVKIPQKINRLKLLIRFLFNVKNTQNISGLFFFFPFYHVGGAERVHIDIVKTIADKTPWIFITNHSDNRAFYNEFNKYGKIFDISAFSDMWITKKIISTKINNASNALTFGCNSHFYYKLIPLLTKEVKCIDLIHAFSDKGIPAAEDWSLPFSDRLNSRVFISKKAIEDLKKQYSENNIPLSNLNKILYICNQVDTPAHYHQKLKKEKLHIVYVGRGTKEKRLHLIAQIAKKCHLLNLPVEIELIGNLKNYVEKEFYPYLNFTGEITDSSILTEKYKKANLILITSQREGFPMVIMEAMSYGVVPLSTEVGDISLHITNEVNGFIIPNYNEEALIVESFIKAIKKALEDQPLLDRMSKNAYEYALRNFDHETFTKKYRTLFLNS